MSGPRPLLPYWPLSNHIQERIKDSEGLELKAYLCPASIPSIGFGHTGKGVHLGLTWTLAQCEAAFQSDLWEMSLAVAQLLGPRSTTQHQFEALVSFAFNEGPAKLAKSTLLEKHRAGNYTGAQAEFRKWVWAHKPDGSAVKLQGLVERRREEAEWYGLPDR